ncbi:hypothetical protein [Chryseobacterium oryctis]|uniref:Uncharacterized protein n=1 Tax=Chryseobacterium oryctis TaxID=2952618 RepID=A0ABT3HMD4_9FLAO|nr:hypothetical protein [Chryseobacterium oryctis]MCW3160855.1 hypothetical protein [Chryseobacterium oryctis]
MEKLQKYCLGVLLVIIYGNISAQISNDAIENNGCKKICEVHHQIFNNDFQVFCSTEELAFQKLNQKSRAVDIIKKYFPRFQRNIGSDVQSLGFMYSQTRTVDLFLLNFERQNKTNNFSVSTYLKNKVSKVRNKDYLDLII